ncbi:putative caspase-16 isoform X1 [Hylobates moloch]|uniref:putative caspase-16 isoform X1 n=1 Tax=Hylobates moloch TaxID=81572 RepID=UPI001362DDAE|nr:putative caspase-16 isoform X1 [Hylobates moloch]
MAHGGSRGQLLGADGQEVQPEALMQELSRCQVLRGRPKIFLLQACRGGNRDAGVGPTALPWYWSWLRTSPSVPSHADVLQIYAEAQGSSCRGAPPGSSDQAGILTVYSAAEGSPLQISSNNLFQTQEVPAPCPVLLPASWVLPACTPPSTNNRTPGIGRQRVGALV